MGPLGWPETVFIVVLALLLFGPKKLPELGRTLGKAITEFRKASAELRSTFDREMKNLERETEAVKENTGAHYQDSYNYDYSSYDTGTPYTPETTAGNETPANGTDLSSHHLTEGASAAPGVLMTAAESQPALIVTPASGTVANGSLHEEPAFPHASGPITDLATHDAAQDSHKS